MKRVVKFSEVHFHSPQINRHVLCLLLVCGSLATLQIFQCQCKRGDIYIYTVYSTPPPLNKTKVGKTFAFSGSQRHKVRKA